MKIRMMKQNISRSLRSLLWSLRCRARGSGSAKALANESGRHGAALTKRSADAIAQRWLLGCLAEDTTEIQPCALASTLPWGVITDTAQAAGEYLSVELLGAIPGTIRAVAAGRIAAGVPVYTAPSGKVQVLPTSAGTYYQVGYSVTDAAANNDELEIVSCVPRQISVEAQP